MIIDLTRPLDKSFIPFSSGKYTDPPLEISAWCDINKEGFRVSRLSLGTQTGTHIDAPAHFVEGGATLEALAPKQCVGSYFLIDLANQDSSACVEKRLSEYRNENILFIRTSEDATVVISREAMQRILSLPPHLIVLSGAVEIECADPFEFHRMIARAGKFLAEDLDQKAAHRLTEKGELFVLPLNLADVSGSPCRVVARVISS